MTTASLKTPAQRAPELLGQTVVVIGGSTGIGLETARHARTEGADVIITARDPERLKEAAHDLGALSSDAFDARAIRTRSLASSTRFRARSIT